MAPPDMTSSPSGLSAHEWERTVWHGRTAVVCARCGYLWKPNMARPTKDCEPDG